MILTDTTLLNLEIPQKPTYAELKMFLDLFQMRPDLLLQKLSGRYITKSLYQTYAVVLLAAKEGPVYIKLQIPTRKCAM